MINNDVKEKPGNIPMDGSPGSHSPKVVNHWGKWIDSEIPVTGVIGINNIPQWVFDEMNYDAIDLTSEVCEAREMEDPECDSCFIDYHELLIGAWKKDDEGLYIPDESGEYSAIVREDVIQVVHSKFTKRCNICSPCYPGQVDLDSDGIYLGFALPPE